MCKYIVSIIRFPIDLISNVAYSDSSGDTLTLSAPGLESITVSRTSPEGVVRDVIETKVWNATSMNSIYSYSFVFFRRVY